MRKTLVVLAGLMFAAGPAHAVTVEAKFSDAFQTKLEDDLGVREGERLAEIVGDKIAARFEKQATSAERVVITIEDATPNRPTMQQVSDTPGLDPIRSFGVGGAKLTGVAYDAAGQEVGTFEYKWYESDITRSMNLGTWHDARWAIDRFARRFAETLS
jgi:hypothetical protein